MNFYTRHIGDYITKTLHLTLAEHGAYDRLLDIYYGTEKPITKDFSRICKMIPTRNAEEEGAVQRVLEEFFVLKDDGWHQLRCDKEIKLCQKNRDNGGKGGRPPKNNNNPNPEKREPINNPDNNTNHNPEETQTITQTKPSRIPLPVTRIPSPDPHDPNPEKISSSNDDSGDIKNDAPPQKRLPVPYEKLQERYNALCPRLRGSVVLDDKTKRNMKKTWDMLGADMQKVEDMLKEANKSDFLAFGNEKWKGADIEFVFRSDKAKATIEGKYRNDRPGVRTDDDLKKQAKRMNEQMGFDLDGGEKPDGD